MNTYLAITYYISLEGPKEECQATFIRPRSRPKPTDRGAARMVARQIEDKFGVRIQPSLVSICRIEEMVYAS